VSIRGQNKFCFGAQIVLRAKLSLPLVTTVSSTVTMPSTSAISGSIFTIVISRIMVWPQEQPGSLMIGGALRALGKAATPLLIAVILMGCSEAGHKNVCPIDGQPPQWSGPRNGHSCEYFHYSIVEKKTHSWWTDCPTLK
jgi:hypothetical protein